MKKRYFIFFLCIIIFLVIISICVMVFSNTNDDKVNDKLQEEISYIETKLLGMLNALNNIPFSNSILLEQNSIKGQSNSNNDSSSQDSASESGNFGGQSSGSDNSSSDSGNESKATDYTKYNVENQNILINEDQEIDWDYMKNTVEVLYSSWPTIMIDLHSMNIKNEDILTFSSNLDALIINIENEDKKSTLNTLAILYSYLPIYIQQFSKDTDQVNIAYTKSCVVNAYVLLEEDKWEDMELQIAKAEEYFNLIINSVKEDRKQNNISKTYVLVNEMNNAIKLKEKNLFYLKYRNLMESAMNI